MRTKPGSTPPVDVVLGLPGHADQQRSGQRRLLVINSNTSAAISALLQRHAQRIAGPAVVVDTVTARFGAPYIADEASYAVAAHATLDAWASAVVGARPAPDRVLIACFGDPGLAALQACSPVPVTGLAEASFILAARHGRFAVVTGGQAWEPILRRLATGSGYADSLACVRAVAPHGDALAADPLRAQVLLAAACNALVAEHRVQAVILGGAGIAGIAAAIQPHVPVPVIDSVEAGVSWALAQPGDTQRRPSAGFDVAWHNLSPELTALGTTAR